MRFAIWLVALPLAFAGEHADLNGVWKNAGNGENLSIHQKENEVEIAESGKEATEIRCNTTGQACKIKGGEVTFWYNGDTLVMMETTHGNARVIKKRLKVSEDGKNLEEEIVHISPAGSTEKVSLERQTGS